MKSIVTLVLLAAWSGSCFAEAKYTAVRIEDPARLELFLRDDSGAYFHRFERLEAWLRARKQQLRFAMNAGMFEPDYSPVGLFVSRAGELAPLNLKAGRGNFYMKPNGVFLVTRTGPKIVESSRYAEKPGEVLLATQSGPLLIEQGVVHPRLSAFSKYIRNGVGVTGNTVVFVVSNVPVSLLDLAMYFKNELNCSDALYLDGSVSGLYSSALGRSDSTVDLGPIIALVDSADE
jgi:uncharacterized protein YigE (DUF2233 family)